MPVWLCVCTQAWPIPQSLLPEGMRVVASLGEGASSWRRKCKRKRPGNRGSISSQGSWRDPWLHTQTSRACWGDRASGPPCGGQDGGCPGRGPASPGRQPAPGAAHLAGQAGGRPCLASRQRPGLLPCWSPPTSHWELGAEQGWRHPEKEGCGLCDQLWGSGRRHFYTQTHKHTLATGRPHLRSWGPTVGYAEPQRTPPHSVPRDTQLHTIQTCVHTYSHTYTDNPETDTQTHPGLHTRLIHTLGQSLSHSVPQTLTHTADTQAFTHFLHSDTPEDKHTDVWRHTLIYTLKHTADTLCIHAGLHSHLSRHTAPPHNHTHSNTPRHS